VLDAVDRLIARAERSGGALAAHRAWPLARVLLLGGGILVLGAWALGELGRHGARAVNPHLFAGFLVACLSMALYAERFRRVVAVSGLAVGRRDACRITLAAIFYQCLVPLAAGADLARFLKLRALAPASRPLAVACGIVLDHLVGLTVLLAMALVLWLARDPAALGFDPRWAALAALVGLGVVAVLATHRRADGAVSLPGRRRDLAFAAGLSCVMQALLAAALWLGSRGWQIDLDYLDILLVLTSALVVQAVPISVAGVGAGEVAGAGLYMALGLSAPAALLMVSLLVGYRLLLAVAGGLWELRSPGLAAASPSGVT